MTSKPHPPNVLLPLTAKERAVLEFIERYVREQGIAPSYQDIRQFFGLASFNSVQRYLRQLQNKNYIYVPGGNLKRAITLLHSSHETQSSLNSGVVPGFNFNPRPSLTKETPPMVAESLSLSLPLLGRVAAGRPIEALEHNEFVSVPAAWVRYPERTYALRVQGESMIEDGIFDDDLIFVEQQATAKNGETVVAMVNHQATVKRFYLHNSNPTRTEKSKNPDARTKKNLFVHSYPQSAAQAGPQVELRPANAAMASLWYPPEQVSIQGLVVGLLRRF